MTINYYCIMFIFYNKISLKQPKNPPKLAMAQLRHLEIGIDAPVFAPTWLRQVSPPPASHDHFNHWDQVQHSNTCREGVSACTLLSKVGGSPALRIFVTPNLRPPV